MTLPPILPADGDKSRPANRLPWFAGNIGFSVVLAVVTPLLAIFVNLRHAVWLWFPIWLWLLMPVLHLLLSLVIQFKLWELREGEKGGQVRFS